jgi:hypothetical protein
MNKNLHLHIVRKARTQLLGYHEIVLTVTGTGLRTGVHVINDFITVVRFTVRVHLATWENRECPIIAHNEPKDQ